MDRGNATVHDGVFMSPQRLLIVIASQTMQYVHSVAGTLPWVAHEGQGHETMIGRRVWGNDTLQSLQPRGRRERPLNPLS